MQKLTELCLSLVIENGETKNIKIVLKFNFYDKMPKVVFFSIAENCHVTIKPKIISKQPLKRLVMSPGYINANNIIFYSLIIG